METLTPRRARSTGRLLKNHGEPCNTLGAVSSTFLRAMHFGIWLAPPATSLRYVPVNLHAFQIPLPNNRLHCITAASDKCSLSSFSFPICSICPIYNVVILFCRPKYLISVVMTSISLTFVSIAFALRSLSGKDKMKIGRRYRDVVAATWHLGFTAFVGPAVQFQTLPYQD